MFETNSYSAPKKFTVVLFLILIALRISDRYLPELFLGIEEIPNWYSYFYISITFVLTSAVMWLNRHNLQRLNIDANFVTIFVVSGVFLSLLYLPVSLGIITGISTIVVFVSWKKKNFILENNRINYIELLLFLIVGLTPNIIYYLIFLTSNPEIVLHLDGSMLIALYDSSLHVVIFEEVLYRGILWMLLKDLKLSDPKVIAIQSFAFWISHYYYINEPLAFWLYIPWMSLLLGAVIWRSKSIASSTFVHFLYNVLMALLRQSF